MTSAAELQEQLQKCVVRLSGPGMRGGTGFFIAPRYVLTCAHVVDGQAGSPVTISWNGEEHQGSVRWSGPRADRDQRVWPHPDLAIVTAPIDGPCVWLDELFPGYDADLLAVGHAKLYGPSAERRPAKLTSPGRIELGTEQLLRISGDELPDGMSGAPVIDLTTGAVCGVVKTARTRDMPHGGVAVPVQALRDLPTDLWRKLWREHDRYHAARGPWPGSLDVLAERRPRELDPAAIVHPDRLQPLLKPTEITELRGLLAELPPPEDLNARYRLACGPNAPRVETQLLDWRDLIKALDDIAVANRGRLHPLLVFAEQTAHRCTRAQVADGLHSWAQRIAVRLGQRPELARYTPPELGSPAAESTAVIAMLEPSALGQERYLCTVWLYRGDEDFEVFAADEAPRPLQEAWAELKSRLPGALNRLDGGAEVMVEFVLPQRLLNEGVDDWQIWPNRKFARLGRRHPVIVRALSTDEDPYSLRRGEDRWKWLAEQDSVPWHWIHCEDARDQEALYSWFEESSNHAALGLTMPPETASARDALEVGLYAGLRVAVWRRPRCEDHAGSGGAMQPCAGKRFRDDLSERLAARRVSQLPHAVKDLRNAAAQQNGTEHCGRDVVLLWDAGRRPESQPLIPLG
ncbi:trypsin-like peptidase domain-containing protein [Saccharopolyspora gloriosae]|uniref:VMAP-C domain-containing protein n=1 Tax=Saccharopolyspora gloriosae TaxID=455344 RepID=UPI001FB7FCB8|nr:trypsin-like peptidase domain-containing protein [Saccharopolyspora gloriosae]